MRVEIPMALATKYCMVVNYHPAPGETIEHRAIRRAPSVLLQSCCLRSVPHNGSTRGFSTPRAIASGTLEHCYSSGRARCRIL